MGVDIPHGICYSGIVKGRRKEEKQISRTSTEVKQRWEKENYKRYVVRLRNDTDKDLIDYIESRKIRGDGTSEIFKELLNKAIQEGD